MCDPEKSFALWRSNDQAPQAPRAPAQLAKLMIDIASGEVEAASVGTLVNVSPQIPYKWPAASSNMAIAPSLSEVPPGSWFSVGIATLRQIRSL
jgi:hypothetical protein